MTNFRNAGVEDWFKIRQIAFATWPDTFGSLLPGVQIDYMLNLIYNKDSLRQQVERSHQFILAEKEGKAVGFSSFEMNYQSMPQFMIHKLYLLPSVQGTGIGTRLLNLLTDKAIQNKHISLRLKVFHLNSKAINFYLKNNFIISGTETTQFENYDDIIDYVMIKKL